MWDDDPDYITDALRAFTRSPRRRFIRGTRSIACKFCHQGGFHWVKTVDDLWRLADDNQKLHACDKHPSAQKPPPPAEAPALPEGVTRLITLDD